MAGYRELPCTIEDVADLLSIEVVKDYGSKCLCKCPFCDDRRGHFEVDRGKNLFHCYRCGVGGGVLHLYAFYYDVSLRQAGDDLRSIFQSDQGRLIRENRPKREVIPQKEAQIATAAERDNTYSNLFSVLKLCSAHQTALSNRGLTDNDIAWTGYRTTPAVRLPRLVKELQSRGCQLEGVPGFFMDEETGEWNLDIRGSGIMLPDRNAKGEIEAIQIRLDEVRKSKFNNLTSTGKYYGTAAHCCPHFVGVQQGAESVILTEGVMKSDIAHRFTQALGDPRGVVGLTGAGMKTQFRRALCELKELDIRRILLAYDMDYHTNDAVEMNRLFAIETGKTEGFDMIPLEWPERYKGIDDVLLAIMRHEDAMIWVPRI